MNAKNLKFIVIVDDDTVNKVINLSILKGLNVVQEIVEFQNGMEILSYIIKLKNLDNQKQEIILFDLKKSASVKYNFMDFFKFINKSSVDSQFFTVLYTPDFEENIFLKGLPDLKIVEKPHKMKIETIPDYYEKDIYNLKLPVYEIIEEPGKTLENEEPI